jgi:hypothetical protein
MKCENLFGVVIGGTVRNKHKVGPIVDGGTTLVGRWTLHDASDVAHEEVKGSVGKQAHVVRWEDGVVMLTRTGTAGGLGIRINKAVA